MACCVIPVVLVPVRYTSESTATTSDDATTMRHHTCDTTQDRLFSRHFIDLFIIDFAVPVAAKQNIH